MKGRSRLLLILAALVHLALLVGWRWQLPLTPYFFDATVLSGGRGLDFYAVYQAGHNARSGRDVYESDPTRGAEIVVPYFTPYRYLPIVAYTAGAGLSLFAPLTAYKIWIVVIELTLLVCVFVTWRLVREPGGTPERGGGADRFAPLALMWLGFTPYYLELFMGQFSLVQGALIFGMLILSDPRPGSLPRAEREVAPAFDSLWIASVLWKINTLLFVPVFVRLRRFRALLAAAALVALTTLPYFLIFPAHLRDFLLNNFGGSVVNHELGNLGFQQLVFEILVALGASPALQRLAQAAVVAIMLGLALLLTFRPPTSDFRLPTSNFQPPTPTLLSLWLTTFFLISPQIWEHHHVMLLPALVIAFWRRPSWVVFAVWLLLALPTPFGFIGLQPVIAANHNLRAFPLEPVWRPLLQHASKALPTLAFFCYLAWESLQNSHPLTPRR